MLTRLAERESVEDARRARPDSRGCPTLARPMPEAGVAPEAAWGGGAPEDEWCEECEAAELPRPVYEGLEKCGAAGSTGGCGRCTPVLALAVHLVSLLGQNGDSLSTITCERLELLTEERVVAMKEVE